MGYRSHDPLLTSGKVLRAHNADGNGSNGGNDGNNSSKCASVSDLTSQISPALAQSLAQSKVVDHALFKSRYGMDTASRKEIFDIGKAEIAGILAEMQSNLHWSTAHKIKGVLASLFFIRASKVACELEMYLRRVEKSQQASAAAYAPAKLAGYDDAESQAAVISAGDDDRQAQILLVRLVIEVADAVAAEP